MITKKKKFIIIVSVACMALFLIGTIVYYKTLRDHESKVQEEVRKKNVGGTGGDYVPEGMLAVVGRGYLTMVLGQASTEVLEEGLKSYFASERLPYYQGGYKVVVEKGSVRPANPPKPWTYTVPILVNDKYNFMLHLDAAPNEEFKWSIDKIETE